MSYLFRHLGSHLLCQVVNLSVKQSVCWLVSLFVRYLGSKLVVHQSVSQSFSYLVCQLSS